jgi:signal transduction histidine kinase
VYGYIQLLQRLAKDADNQKAILYLTKTNTYINRLNTLIADLLDVSRIQAGRMEFNLVEFDFDELIKDSVESVQLTTTTHKIEFVGEANVKITADRNRLEQVLGNLLINAVKYSPRANKVIVTVKRNNNRDVEVAIQDFGIGIPKENQSLVFERFYRVESNTKGFSGLGIGLYICSEIIKRHFGTLKVESEEGKGSTFTFSLPTTPDI